MKICFLDDLKPLGEEGSSVHKWELLNNLSKLGLEIHLFTNKTENIKKSSVHKVKRNIISFPIKIFKINKKIQCDILYSRNITYGFLGILISKIQNSKFILELNGIPTDEWKIYKKYNLKQNLNNKLNRFCISFLSKFVYRNSDGIIVVTPLIKKYLILNKVKREKIKVINNGVNQKIFKPTYR